MREQIEEALTKALADVGQDDSQDVPQPSKPLRQAVAIVRQASLPNRLGRFSPARICVFCNVAEAEHGKVCGTDDYTEWQRQLREACKGGTPIEPGYVARRQAAGWAGNDGAAHKLARP